MVTSDIPLKISSLCKEYSNNRVVDNVSFEIAPGEIFGLLGPNGAGKSTLINMVAGVTKIGSGTVSVFGYDNQKDYRTTRRLTGVMHQEIVIEQFFTIGRALQIHAGYYGVKDDPTWRNTLIDRLDLRPHLHKKFIKLSGGMKRRMMVAKALIHKPQLLILDEPTAGVDVDLRRKLWDFVREINLSGTTVLLTTHYLEEAEEMCNRVAIMNEGKIVALEKTSYLINKIGERKLIVYFSEEPSNLLSGALSRYKPEIFNSECKIEFSLNSGKDVAEIIHVMRENNLPLVDFELSKPDLEDVFLLLTGKTLE